MKHKELLKQGENKKLRLSEIRKGNMIYEILSEEKKGEKETISEIIKRMMKSYISNEYDKRTCCFVENGGKGNDIETNGL